MYVNRYDIINAKLDRPLNTVIGMLNRSVASVIKPMVISSGNRHGRCDTLQHIAYYDVTAAIEDYKSRLNMVDREKYYKRTQGIIEVLTKLEEYKNSLA